MKFSHVAIIVSDIDKSLHFYERTLGFRVVSKLYREERNSWKVDIEREEMRLELFTFPAAPARPSYPEAIGLRHLAFEVQNLNELYEKLKEEKIEVEEIRLDQETGKRFFFFADPDDLPLEIYEA